MSMTLTDSDIQFMAARVRRLCRAFEYPIPDDRDDEFIVGVAGSLIGGLLVKAELIARDAERYRWIREHRIGVKWCELYSGGAALDEAIDSTMKAPPSTTAKARFDKAGGHEEPDPIERLRFFSSKAMSGQDWLDVEQFFDAVIAERDALAARLAELEGQEPVAWYADYEGWGREYNGLPELSNGVIGKPLYTRPAPAEPVNARLLDALKLAECVYRKNVVNEGEPSSVLEAIQAAITAAEAQRQTDYSSTVDRAWARFCGAFGDGPDAPYPGMIAAFETHYGQSFRDKAWRTEAACWAAAWHKATEQASRIKPPKSGD